MSQLMVSIRETFAICLGIIESKNHDYAGKDTKDEYKNFRDTFFESRFGADGVENSIRVLLKTKFIRLENLLFQEAKNESIEDTINDTINYLAILKAYREYKQNKTPSTIIKGAVEGFKISSIKTHPFEADKEASSICIWCNEPKFAKIHNTSASSLKDDAK